MPVNDLLNARGNSVKELEKLIAQQMKMIERLRAPRVKAKRAKAKLAAKGKPYLRIFCGDSHGAYADGAAVDAFIHDLGILQPKEIYHVGDILEAGTFLAQHHVIGTVAQSKYTFEDDVNAANDLLDRIQGAVPGADITLIEGNHDARIEKACVTWSLQKQIDAAYLLKLFSPRTVLNLDKRRIRFVQRGDFVDGLTVSGVVPLDFDVLVMHGEQFCGPNATRQLVQAMGTSVIHGHNHRLDCFYGDLAGGVVGGWGTGCLCTRRPLWQMTKTTGWVNGYLAMAVLPGVGYTCFPVPIINGVSYMPPLLKMLRAA